MSCSANAWSPGNVVEPVYMVPVYLLALAGLFVVATPFRVLALCFVGYETLAAWVFAGTTRYRVTSSPYDAPITSHVLPTRSVIAG